MSKLKCRNRAGVFFRRHKWNAEKNCKRCGKKRNPKADKVTT